MKKIRERLAKFDKTILFIPAIIVIALGVLITIFATQAETVIMAVRTFIGDKFGWYYLLFGLATFLLLLYLAFSKVGKIRLGKETDKPMKLGTYGILIFTSTMAADILFYAMHEWTYYFNSNNALTGAGSTDQMLNSSTYTYFHWGLIPWAFYLVLAVIYAFMFFTRKKRDTQGMGQMCLPLFEKTGRPKLANGLKSTTNVIAVVGLLLGTSTTFSVTTPLMTAIVCKLFGIASSPVISVVILCIIAIIYTAAVLVGHKGISIVAKITTILFSLLLALFFIMGNPLFILENGIQGIGNMFINFFSMATWTDPARVSGGFVQDWTVFYWAYWIAWCVATPFFIAKISKGRTIKQVLLQGGTAGLLGTFASFTIFGGFGMSAQASGFDFAGMIASGASPAQCIIELICSKGSGFWYIALPLLLLTMFGLYASTFDALTDVVSSFSYKKLDIDASPSKPVKIYWALLFLVLPIALIFLDGTNHLLQSMSIIGAFLLTFIMICIVISFFIELKRHNAKPNTDEEAENDTTED